MLDRISLDISRWATVLLKGEEGDMWATAGDVSDRLLTRHKLSTIKLRGLSQVPSDLVLEYLDLDSLRHWIQNIR